MTWVVKTSQSYDGNGNRIKKQGEQRLGDIFQPSAVTYKYNVRGQLLEERRLEKLEDVITRYHYDAAGNRVRKECSEGEIYYGYNEKNQLTCQEGIQGQASFTYSRQGSIILEEGPNGIREFAYNSKNQQVKVKCGNGQIQENRYDAEGLRHEMKENEKLLRFVYHRGELLYKRGKDEKSYHLGCGIEAVSGGGEISYYHRNEQLSTALMTGEAGDVRNYYQYDAFGVLLEAGEKAGNRVRYTGQQYDGVTEQYYLRARYYNPVLGRFMQEDPYHGDGLNLYAYCANNPVMYYDPSGYALKDSDYANIMYDTDGSGYAYVQNRNYTDGLKNTDHNPYYEGSNFQAHHLLQGKWAKANLKDYYTDSNGNTALAPHNYANFGQGARRDARGGDYSSTLNSELVFGATDLIRGGMSEGLVMSELERNYRMIDALNSLRSTQIQNGELDLLEYDRVAIESVVHDFAEQQRLENERMIQNNC